MPKQSTPPSAAAQQMMRQFFETRDAKRERVLACLAGAHEALQLARDQHDSTAISAAVHACIAAEQQLAGLGPYSC